MIPAAWLPADGGAPAAALLGELRELAGGIVALDLEAADGDTVEVEVVARTVRRLLERALEVLPAVQRLDDDPDLDPALDPALDPTLDPALDPALGPPLGEIDGWPGVASEIPGVARIADVCFAGRMELRRVLCELDAASDDDMRLVAADAGRRKLWRAAQAVIAATHARGLCEDVHALLDARPADVSTALVIRRLYARFRRDLRRPTSETPEAVLTAVRYAGGALAALVSDPRYGDVRLSDRLILRRLRERALVWARHDRSVTAGLQLLEDVSTCGNLLRGINRRQELRDHDRAAIPRLIDGARGDAAAWFAELEALYGLDDDIDEIYERARKIAGDGGALDRLVPEALIRLRQVQ